MPRFEASPVAARKRFFPLAERPRQDFGDGERRDCQSNFTGSVTLKKRQEALRKGSVAFEYIDDGRGIDEDDGARRQRTRV